MKTKRDFIKLVRDLIIEMRVVEALNLIEKYAIANNDNLNALTMIRAQSKSNESNFFSNKLKSKEDYQIEINRINTGILNVFPDMIADKTRFDENDWRDLLGQSDSIKNGFLNPQITINDDLYKKKIVTIIEYILKKSTDKTLDALHLCDVAILEVNSTLPHAYEYRALCNFIITPIENILERVSVKIIEDLAYARRLGKSENYDKIIEFIGFRLESLISSEIHRLKRESLNIDKELLPSKRREILKYIIAYEAVCYPIHPMLDLRKIVIEELSGHHELAWLNFERFSFCNDDDFSLIENTPNLPIKIIDYITEQIKFIQEFEKEYESPRIKIGTMDSVPRYIEEQLHSNRIKMGWFLLAIIFSASCFYTGDLIYSILLSVAIVMLLRYFRASIPFCIGELIYLVRIF